VTAQRLISLQIKFYEVSKGKEAHFIYSLGRSDFHTIAPSTAFKNWAGGK
jgi:hypothetical protein